MPFTSWRAAAAVSLLTVILAFSNPRTAFTQTNFGGGGSVGVSADGRMLFGGRILDVDTCTCPYNGAYMWLRVGPPVARDIVLTFSSLQYLYYAYRTGNWTLGDAGPVPLACADIQCGRKGCWCVSVEYGFPVIHIGTSLVGGGEVQAP